MADTQKSAPAEEAPAKAAGKPPVLLIIIALCSVASMGVSTMALLQRPHAQGEHAAKPKGEVVTERKDLGEFLVNLADPGTDAFVKATIVLEYEGENESGKKGGKGGHGGGGEEEEAAPWETPVRDAIINTISQFHREDLRSAGGKELLKKRILTEVNAGEGEDHPKFTAVYFTSFAMQ